MHTRIYLGSRGDQGRLVERDVLEEPFVGELVQIRSTEKVVQLVLSKDGGICVDDTSLAGVEHAGSSPVQKTKLFIRPNILDGVHRDADARSSALLLPSGETLELKLVKDDFDGVDEVIELFGCMSGGRSDAETFLANGDRGVVDRLDIDTVLIEEGVGGLFG